jgi:tripartite-type tricarboxylate transporter receptor subunit TctC
MRCGRLRHHREAAMVLARLILLPVVFALAFPAAAAAQSSPAAGYPNKPIRLIVGFGAGGGTDLLTRIVAPKLAEVIGQPVVIENRTGAGGRIAIEFVQSQPADGHTVAIGAIGQLAVSSAIYADLPFHPTRTLIPVAMLSSYPLVLSSQATGTIKSVKDLVAYGKANPDKSNYPTASPAFTLPSELFKLKTGIPGQTVPYRSANEMVLSVVGGQSLYTFADSGITVPQAKAGKIRSLAVANPTRIAELPDVPTMPEAGLADVDIKPQWNGAFLTAGTPPAIVAKLEAALREVLVDPSVREKIRAMTYYPEGMGSAEFRARIDSDIKIFQEIVKAANLKFER